MAIVVEPIPTVFVSYKEKCLVTGEKNASGSTPSCGGP